jgi:hypothetical protein
MKMCSAILKYTEFNLMTIQNLAIVLGPNMLYDRAGDELEDNMVRSARGGVGSGRIVSFRFVGLF